MEATVRIESAIAGAIESAASSGAPSRLSSALGDAVFPGGARVRPRLCLAVGRACGDDAPAVLDAAAAAIELLHCASLVHDDLPCFDDAETRRGRPSIHRAYGERIAVLTGDALIVLAYETLARGAASHPARLVALMRTIGSGVGMPHGIVAGQAWECEPRVALADYQQAKTGALFVAACVAGAQAAGRDPTCWRRLGERLGEAYQVADDVRDVAADPAALGKPIGRDAALGRPSAAEAFGLAGAVALFERLVADALASIPECAGAPKLRALIRAEAERLLPEEFVKHVA